MGGARHRRRGYPAQVGRPVSPQKTKPGDVHDACQGVGGGGQRELGTLKLMLWRSSPRSALGFCTAVHSRKFQVFGEGVLFSAVPKVVGLPCHA